MAGNSIGIIRAFYRLGVRYVSYLNIPINVICQLVASNIC